MTTTVQAPAEPTPPAATEPVQPQVPAQPEKEQDNASRHFAALAKRERALLEREKSLKEQASRYADLEAKEKARRENPDTLLADYGYTFDDLIKRKANGGKMTAEQLAQKAVDELESFKKQRDSDIKRQEEEKKASETKAQQEKEAQAIEGFKSKIGEYLDTNKDKYELTLAQDDPVDLVYNVIDAHYENTKSTDGTGRILSFEEASNHVEKFFDSESEKLLSLSKIKSKVSPKEAEPSEAADHPVNARRAAKESTTLSSDLQSRSESPKDETPLPKDPRAMIEESKRKAAALLRWGP